MTGHTGPVQPTASYRSLTCRSRSPCTSDHTGPVPPIMSVGSWVVARVVVVFAGSGVEVGVEVGEVAVIWCVW